MTAESSLAITHVEPSLCILISELTVISDFDGVVQYLTFTLKRTNLSLYFCL